MITPVELRNSPIASRLDGGIGYEYDIVLVLRDPVGQLWAAHDAGASWPEPFEDHSWPGDFTKIEQVSDLDPLIREVADAQPTAIVSFKTDIRRALP